MYSKAEKPKDGDVRVNGKAVKAPTRMHKRPIRDMSAANALGSTEPTDGELAAEPFEDAS